MLSRELGLTEMRIELWNTKGADGVEEVFAPHFHGPGSSSGLRSHSRSRPSRSHCGALQGAIGQAQFEARERVIGCAMIAGVHSTVWILAMSAALTRRARS
jgi:hypothetical protein